MTLNNEENEVPDQGPMAQAILAFIGTQVSLIAAGALFTQNVWLGILMLFVYGALISMTAKLEKRIEESNG